MADQTIPQPSAGDLALAREWAQSVLSGRATAVMPWEEAVARVLHSLLPAPTLADMTDDERAACQWMQADVANRSVRYVIANPYDVEMDGEVMILSADGKIEWMRPCRVTPRPDLPRLGWPGDKKPEDVPPVKVGDVIESADDPRLDTLPVGSVLADCDGHDVEKTERVYWKGDGFIPLPTEGRTFGPWTVCRIGKEDDQ